ncbi:alpha-acetolactate decarboxylase [Colletotrichum scovillei]|uniref:alpha-acetolactate decarboxylase n=1 Tax=Colletotrichum scovillei TaxID=1209932 RepID=UPI0015C2F8C2|nr:alpha-acetolactate decarboxylase [Colletotrichum scovillei]KAF4782851.1 alpha-acetolactate decarboxylase [Colletotrichum scovillei]
MAVNEIFQYSIISALMDGVASKGLPVSDLISHGNQGLGTFRYMVGEMIILDGKLYQMKSDNTVTPIDTSPASDAVAPFAMVTRFQPTATIKAAFNNKKELFEHLSQDFPDSKNFFLAIRIEVSSKPGESLTEVGKHQASHTFEEPVRGTVVGFRSPEYTMGISVAGDHLHFITEDRTQGGHILSFGTDGEVKIGAAQISKWHVELPTNDPEFNKAALEGDKEGIAAVEG